jgi:hypothetical protein
MCACNPSTDADKLVRKVHLLFPAANTECVHCTNEGESSKKERSDPPSQTPKITPKRPFRSKTPIADHVHDRALHLIIWSEPQTPARHRMIIGIVYLKFSTLLSRDPGLRCVGRVEHSLKHRVYPPLISHHRSSCNS